MRISVDIKTTVASWEKLARFVRHEKLLFYFKTTSFWGYFGAKPWGRERSAAENSQLIPIFSLENQEIDFFEKILEKMNIFVKLKWKKVSPRNHQPCLNIGFPENRSTDPEDGFQPGWWSRRARMRPGPPDNTRPKTFIKDTWPSSSFVATLMRYFIKSIDLSRHFWHLQFNAIYQ